MERICWTHDNADRNILVPLDPKVLKSMRLQDLATCLSEEYDVNSWYIYGNDPDYNAPHVKVLPAGTKLDGKWADFYVKRIALERSGVDPRDVRVCVELEDSRDEDYTPISCIHLRRDFALTNNIGDNVFARVLYCSDGVVAFETVLDHRVFTTSISNVIIERKACQTNDFPKFY